LVSHVKGRTQTEGIENRMLRRIFGPKRDKVTTGSRKLQKDFRDIYSSPHIITMINTSTIRWAGHVGRIGKMRNAYKFLSGKPEGESHSEDQGVDGRIRWISAK
jgi:hypothetical protein